MTKLINSFTASQTPKNRQKLQAYIKKHSMAVCMLTTSQLDFLKAHHFDL